jgi:hypothetical protein
MTLAEVFRPSSSIFAPASVATRNTAYDGHADCGDRFRLRADYIHRLAEFNEVAARHRIVVRTGLEGPAAEASWRKFREACAASNAAWARYRKHLSAHGCKQGAVEMASAA